MSQPPAALPPQSPPPGPYGSPPPGTGALPPGAYGPPPPGTGAFAPRPGNPQPGASLPRAPKPPDTRPLWKKKRLLIPAGVVALVIVGSAIVAGAGDDEPIRTEDLAVGQEASRQLDDAEDASERPTAADREREAEEARREREAEEARREREAEEAAAREVEEARLAEEQRLAEEAAAAAEAARIGTAAQQNAYRSAVNYLDFTAFSRTGLIGQLEFEGYATADAEFAIARLEAEGGVDWNAQAAASAANYLSFMPFSHSGLVDQLIFEGFTRDQAEYGVSTTGL